MGYIFNFILGVLYGGLSAELFIRMENRRSRNAGLALFLSGLSAGSVITLSFCLDIM